MRPVKGRWIYKRYPKTASVTFTAGNLVMFTSGVLATATAQSTKHLGIIMEAIASTDSDFADAYKASGKGYLVAVPTSKSCEFESTVTGTLATTDLGVTFDLSNASTVNKAGTTYDVVTCKKFISTAKGYFTLNSSLDFADSTWE